MKGGQPGRRRGGVRRDPVFVEHVLRDVHDGAAVPPIEQPVQPEAFVRDVGRKPHRELGLVVAHRREPALAVTPPDLRRRRVVVDEAGAVRKAEVAGRRERRHRHGVQEHDAHVFRERDARHPAHVLCPDGEGQDRRVDAAVADLGGVAGVEDALGEAGARPQRLLQDQVGVVLLIHGGRDRQARVEQSRVDAGFDLPVALRVERRIGDHVARRLDGEGVLPRIGRAAQRRELLAVQWLVSSLAVRYPDLDLFEGAERRPAERRRDLRIGEQFVDVGVVRALLHQHAARHEQALVEQEQLFLPEHRQRAGALPVLEHTPGGAAIHVLLTRQEILGHVVGRAQVIVPAAHAGRRGGREGLRDRGIAVGDGRGDRGLRFRPGEVARQTGQTGLLPVQRSGRVEVRLHRVGVDAPVDGRAQCVRLTAQERVGRVGGADEAKQVFRRLKLAQGLQEVGPAPERERVERVHTVHRALVEEAGRLPDHEVRRDVDVVVVADAALCERMHQVRVRFDLQLRADQLDEVEPDPLLVPFCGDVGVGKVDQLLLAPQRLRDVDLPLVV